MSDVTSILQAIEHGDAKAAEQLLAIVYDELHRMASRNLASEAPGQTLQTTALIHEAYMRLLPNAVDSTESGSTLELAKQSSWQSRRHFFASAAEAMRRILIDNARKRRALKRGGDRVRIDWDDVDVASPVESEELLALNEALSKLETQDERRAEVVKLRYFGGLTLEEVAAATGASVPTVHRHWRYARAWLRREMEDCNESEES